MSARSKFISYYKDQLELESAKEEKQTLDNNYQLAVTRRQAGTGTEMDVLDAQEQILEQEKTIARLEQEIEYSRQSLLVMLGWQASDNPEICALPQFALAELDSINLEADKQSALEQNYTLQINKRKLENARDADNQANINKTIRSNAQLDGGIGNLPLECQWSGQCRIRRGNESFKRHRMSHFCLAVTAITFSLSPAYSFAAQAEEAVYQAVDGHQISAERLQDNTIEYEELGSLIHANNITVQNLITSSDNQKQTYIEAVDFLEEEKASANRNKKDAKDSGDMESYAEYASWEAIYSSSIKSYNNMIARLDKYSANKSRIQVEQELTKAAQSLMVSYESVILQKEYLAKMEQLSGKQYAVAVKQKQAGLATDLDVQSAYSQWLSAQATVSSLTDTEDSLYRSLCLMLGVNETSSMNVQKISATNLNCVIELDLEADMEKAVNNNYDGSKPEKQHPAAPRRGIKRLVLQRNWRPM